MRIFTDGHCSYRGRRAQFASWGFVVKGVGDSAGVGETSLAACGPVILDSKVEYYVGATRYSSNTGDISAIIEACSDRRKYRALRTVFCYY